MNKLYSALILTDHHTHTAHDSIYELVKKIDADPRAESTYIVSRSSFENSSFFSQNDQASLFGKKASNDFRFEKIESWFNLLAKIDIQSFDVVILRMDHPVPNDFLKWLKNIAVNSLFINDPLGITKTSSKEYILKFKTITPWSKVYTSIDDINRVAKQRPIVIKPLKGYGAQGLVKIESGKYYIENKLVKQQVVENQIKNELVDNGKVLVNEYLKRVTEGDKRILIVNNKIVGSFLRLPQAGSWLANLAQGGTVKPAKINQEEKEIASILIEDLFQLGIVMFGFDTLMGNNNKRLLTEINTTNVGGFIQAENSGHGLSMTEVATLLWDYVEKRV